MCGGGGGQTPMPTPQQIQPRQPDLVRASRLPESRDVVDPDEVAGVEYGQTAQRDTTRGAAKRTGTDALKINLNTGTGAAGQGTGGVNV